VNTVFTDRILYKLKMCKNSNLNIIYVQEQYIFPEYTVLHSAQRNGPLRNSVTIFLPLVFFMNQFLSPQPQRIPLGPFRIFSKIRGDIFASQGAPLVTNFATNFVRVVDIGGKPVVLMVYSGAWGKLI
jgi:hypothetical protein